MRSREDCGSVNKTRGFCGFTWGQVQKNVFDGFMLQLKNTIMREYFLTIKGPS